MKIIDEKAKLFGIINIIDFLVLFFFISLIPMFLFGNKLFNRKVPSAPQALVETEVSCNLIKISPDTLPLINVGDKQIDTFNQTIGEIIWLGEPAPFQQRISLGAADKKMIPVLNYKEIPAKIRLKGAIENAEDFFYNNQQIQVNMPFTFRTEKYMIKAVPITPEKWFRVKVRFTDIPTELSAIISNDHVETDSRGKITARIIEILNNQPSPTQTVAVENNAIVLANDPTRCTITALMDLLCHEKEEGYFYGSCPLKIGVKIPFSSNLYLISGTIFAFDEKQ